MSIPSQRLCKYVVLTIQSSARRIFVSQVQWGYITFNPLVDFRSASTRIDLHNAQTKLLQKYSKIALENFYLKMSQERMTVLTRFKERKIYFMMETWAALCALVDYSSVPDLSLKICPHGQTSFADIVLCM